MARLVITHLTFLGENVQPAGITFSDGMTLVRGPSDTGKSFIVDAIDFMMGATSLKEIPERNGYSTVLLGLLLPSGEKVTLSRAVIGGGLGLYRSDVRSNPLPVPDDTLSPTHSPTSEGNVSRFLLSAAGLDQLRVRKNARNETDSLSFRNIAHLCIVDETQMQSEVPPALSGSYVTKTKEVSVFKLLLQDEDDSDLIAVDDGGGRRRVARAKLEVVDGMLAELLIRLGDHSTEDQVRSQLARLNVSIDTRIASIDELGSRRAELIAARTRRQDDVVARERRIAEATSLIARFNLLLTQYESDLERLEMISEAGSLLGFFERGTCVFCGADIEHQHLNQPEAAEGTHLEQSVVAERAKTSALRDDLRATLGDLGSERRTLRSERASALRVPWLPWHKRVLPPSNLRCSLIARDSLPYLSCASLSMRRSGCTTRCAPLSNLRRRSSLTPVQMPQLRPPAST